MRTQINCLVPKAALAAIEASRLSTKGSVRLQVEVVKRSEGNEGRRACFGVSRWCWLCSGSGRLQVAARYVKSHLPLTSHIICAPASNNYSPSSATRADAGTSRRPGEPISGLAALAAPGLLRCPDDLGEAPVTAFRAAACRRRSNKYILSLFGFAVSHPLNSAL